ncbi:MAG: molybdopterin molybdenumtransferase MoeA [Porphyromonadaceae bacterium]|nr:MAG: molybdopterin molybdenumtransferase MoeA [Porphyromonadaceae bacterium]
MEKIDPVFFMERKKVKKITLVPNSFVMITFEEALKISLNQAVTFGIESVSFEEATGRVLAESIKSDMDIPPFNKSAMDGYACRRQDLAHSMQVIEVIRAGIPPVKSISEGTCSQIMTGAIIPDGADTVVKVEDCTGGEADAPIRNKIRFVGEKTGANICYRGEDMKAGEVVLEAGTLLDSRHVPILATVGSVFIKVYRLPSVGVLSTGTELVEPGETPGLSKIRNTNAYQMIAQLGKMGIDCDYYGIAADDEDITRSMISEALENNDILILSGGISMGEFDFVPAVLQSLGIYVAYKQVAIQPGKPTLFGTGQNKFVFGLPGNPISSYFILELLVKPFIYKCMAYDWNPPVLRLRAGERMTRKKSNRLAWMPVRIDQEGLVYQIEYHGSAHIFSLRDADGIIPVPIGKAIIEEGEFVDVRPL